MEHLYKTLKRKYRGAKVTSGKYLTEKVETKALRDVFVKLMVFERGDLKSAFTQPTFGFVVDATRGLEHVLNGLSRKEAMAELCVELSDIFPLSASANESYRVLVLAGAGYGKTTLVMKHCPLMWANGVLWSGEFDLLICGQLGNKDICCAKDIGELLGGWERLGITSDEDKQSIVDFIVVHPHRVCIILDGLNDTKLEHCSRFITDILCGKQLCGVRLILASCPCDEVFSLCAECPFSKSLGLAGFRPADVEKYVRCVLSEEQAAELLGILAQDENLAGTMSTPFVAEGVCGLFKYSQRIPRCVFDMSEWVILKIAERSWCKSFRSFKELPADFQKDMLDLGEYAFRMLLAGKICFTELEITAYQLSEKALLLGRLVSCEPSPIANREHYYRFSRLVSQEFLSALFVATSGSLYPGYITRLVEALGALSWKLSTFWPMLAAHLDSECMDCLCHSLLCSEHVPLPVSKMESLLFDHNTILIEIENALCELLSGSSMEVLAAKLLQGLVMGDAVTAIENEMQCGHPTSNNDFLHTLLGVWLRSSPKAHLGTLLAVVRAVDSSAAAACCEIDGIGFLPNPQDIGYATAANARKELVHRCFVEYSHGSVPPVCHLPSGIISAILASVGVNAFMKRSECDTLQHVLKHHSDDVAAVQASMSECESWHWSLYNQLVKSGKLASLEVHNPGRHDFLPSSLLRNKKVKNALFCEVPSTSLLSIAAAVDKWPSLEKLRVHIVTPSNTTGEEAVTFLSAVGRHGSLRYINLCGGAGGPLSQHYLHLQDQNAYPSTVVLDITTDAAAPMGTGVQDSSSVIVDIQSALVRELENTAETCVRRAYVCVCGQYGTGKSSLLDSLRNRPHDDIKQSTLVATICDTIFSGDKLTDTEITAADFISRDVHSRVPEEEKSRLLREVESRRQLQPLPQLERRNGEDTMERTPIAPESPIAAERRLNEGQASLDVQHTVPQVNPKLANDTSKSCQASTNEDDPLALNIDHLKSKILNDILSDNQIMRDVQSSEIVITTCDCGGQSIFSGLQHMHMGSDYVVYVLCFKASEGLHVVTDQTYVQLCAESGGATKKVVRIAVPERLANVDHVRHWLTNIHFHHRDGASSYPPVVIVGTFADKLDSGTLVEEHKTRLWNELKGHCRRLPTFNTMLKSEVSSCSASTMYLVDNTLSGVSDNHSEEVVALCRHLKRAMNSVLEEKRIKKEWLRFEWVLQHLRRQCQANPAFPGYTDHDYVCELISKVCRIDNATEKEEMLVFYDGMRQIAYRPDPDVKKDIVVFDLKWLGDQFNRLIYGPCFTSSEQDEENEEETAWLRYHLCSTGHLSPELVNCVWKHDKAVSAKLLKILESWDLLYPLGSDWFLVPFALKFPPASDIVRSMRVGDPCQRVKVDVPISTHDTPLLIKVQPRGSLVNGPDTPLPHSYYFRLLVKLMKKFDIQPPTTNVHLQYNSAWVRIPNKFLGLNGFRNCSASLYLAHFEKSGAIVLSACIRHSVETFKPNLLTSRDGRRSVTIATILCRIREEVIKSLGLLSDVQRFHPDLFLVPFPIACNCSMADTSDGSRTQSSDLDLGDVAWKIKVKEDSSKCGTDDTSSPGTSEVEWFGSNDSCIYCGELYEIPDNADAWFKADSDFKVCPTQLGSGVHFR